MLQASTTRLTDYSTIYVGEPDIPVGMTVSGYRQARPHRVAWWRSLLRRSSVVTIARSALRSHSQPCSPSL